MSSALVWQLIRDGSTNTAVRRNHSHLDRASLCGHFGTKGNVLSCKKIVDVKVEGKNVVLLKKNFKKANKPIAYYTKIGLSNQKAVAAKTIEAAMQYYRTDVVSFAHRKYDALVKSLRK